MWGHVIHNGVRVTPATRPVSRADAIDSLMMGHSQEKPESSGFSEEQNTHTELWAIVPPAEGSGVSGAEETEIE